MEMKPLPACGGESASYNRGVGMATSQGDGLDLMDGLGALTDECSAKGTPKPMLESDLAERPPRSEPT